MKYIVILGDGMSDYPVPELGGKTPLQYADLPTIDYMAKRGVLGMAKTVPEGMPPGSDTANLAVMGYDPREYYSGRSPFEAASMGVPLKDTDITFRCNVVTLSDHEPYEEKLMLDHSSDEITSEESHKLLQAINERFGTDSIRFYPGVSYRHLMVWDRGPYEWKLTPPHDIIGKRIGGFLPQGTQSEIVERIMRESFELLSEHPVNKSRVARGLKPANSSWIWGEGKKPALSSFYEKYKLKGSVISAVDLIKGIGLCAGLESIDVPGATGNIHTNFRGKGEAALDALKRGQDFVYVHIEAPDESGHRYEIENKVKAIELIDSQIIRVLKEGLESSGEAFRMMILPDHPTPLSLRTHTGEPVPFLIYRSDKEVYDASRAYDEYYPQNTGLYFDEGHRLMDYFISGK